MAFTVHLPENLESRLRMCAQTMSVSEEDLVRRALDAYLDVPSGSWDDMEDEDEAPGPTAPSEVAPRDVRLVPIASSMISAAGYDVAAKEMEIVFTSGDTYRYARVPRRVYDGLLASTSKGRYMREYVIDCYPTYPVDRRRRR